MQGQNRIIKKCPTCGEEMVISSLKCPKCGIVINGEFGLPEESSDFARLNESDIDFLKTFLLCEGNYSKVEKTLELTRSELKIMLRDINIKLGIKDDHELPDIKKYLVNSDDEQHITPSGMIINRFNQLSGKALCPMLRGFPIEIWCTEKGVRNSGFPDLVCEWKIFDAIVEKAKELGGTMYRGDSAAQNGAKIGSDELGLDTIDSFISLNFYEKKVGDTTLRRSTYYAAIMAWAGICDNCRSKGEGGYIKLKDFWFADNK